MKTKSLIIFSILLLFYNCDSLPTDEIPVITREEAIPPNAIKMTPETDDHPPILHSNNWARPVPVQGGVNTAGAEDSPFIPIGRDELYFFFTPDVSVPVEKQLLDGVTGIFMTQSDNGIRNEIKRVLLQDQDKLALDGCTFVAGDTMWFCSAREGYTELHWFTAEFINGKWTNWELADFKPEYKVGELHIHEQELFFHSDRSGGKGNYDIWVSTLVNGAWDQPVNIEIVNTDKMDGFPYISQDGNELWFTREYFGTPAIFLSKKIANEWQVPELIVSQFAGEPTLDADGNLYFVHHFYKNGAMIEADIYVAYRK